MELNKIVNSLHPLETKIIPVLQKFSKIEDIVKETGLKYVEVMRALQWLQNKGVVKINYSTEEIISLDENGKKYLEIGLPERRFLNVILKYEKKSFDEIKRIANLTDEEFSVSLGILKQKGFINIMGNEVSITEVGKSFNGKSFLEENFIKKISKERVSLSNLLPEERFAFEALKKRRNIIKFVDKNIFVELTELGRKISSTKFETNVIDRLTTEMLIKKEWKNKIFRRYDVKVNVPKIFAAKKQHYRSFLDYVRKKFISLGFAEMNGPIVETEFWNMDALFMPQFHSARDIHDVYYIKEPKYGEIDKNILNKVKETHENGGNSGSRGWRYRFDSKKTKRLILRSQGTACSARMLASKELKIPGKYFGIARCFRHDVVDATHNVDFYQTEGIVVEENLTIRHLFGLLKMFAEEFAKTKEIKIVPAYFPFTEPSCELFAKHKDLGWLELGGAGMLRPEVVIPLVGRNISVLAWGLGIDRIALFNLGLNDIRSLFSHDLEFLRNAKVF